MAYSLTFEFIYNASISSETITTNSAFIRLLDLKKKTRFEPLITGSFNDSKFNFRTESYLLFPKREEALESLIEFHKFLIDTLKNTIC